MKIVPKEELIKLLNGEEVEITVLIKDYTVGNTKNGGKYLNGSCESKGVIPFKVWSGGTLDEMLNKSYRGKVVDCKADINIYNGSFGLILKEIKESNVSPLELAEKPYDSEAMWKRLNKILKDNMSDVGYTTACKVLEEVEEPFKSEVAAVSFHDNVFGGLLAHCYKMCLVLGYSLKMYKNIGNSCDKDLLYFGVLLHDIGKIKEYSNGSRSEVYFGGHTAFGVEYVSSFKDQFLLQYGEEWYYRLISIISQHHGEFGEAPRTKEALFIHYIDMFESKVQMLNQTLPIEDQVYIDKFRII